MVLFSDLPYRKNYRIQYFLGLILGFLVEISQLKQE